VDLVRYTLAENIINNGKFTEEVVNNKIPSWEGSAQVGKSEDYTESW
jgi:hypothetical protein